MRLSDIVEFVRAPEASGCDRVQQGFPNVGTAAVDEGYPGRSPLAERVPQLGGEFKPPAPPPTMTILWGALEFPMQRSRSVRGGPEGR